MRLKILPREALTAWQPGSLTINSMTSWQHARDALMHIAIRALDCFTNSVFYVIWGTCL